jgi:hypothetical protein
VAPARREAAAEEDAADAKATAARARELTAKAQAETANAKKQLASERAAAREERARVMEEAETAAMQEGRMHAVEEEARGREAKARRQLAEERGRHEAATAAWERERAEFVAKESSLLDKIRELQRVIEQRDAAAEAAAEEAAAAAAAAAAAKNAEAEKASEGDQGDQVVAALTRAARSVSAGGESGVRLAIDRATEELQRRLRASDSEVIIANDRIKSLEKTQRELANELMSATRLIDEVGNPADLKRQLTALEDRHVDALEMMGETSEENEELKERTAALKSMVDALTEKVAALEAARAEASS